MYEEERRFSWTNLFIKIIVAIIIILFIVWLLSLTNKKVSNKLDIITDNIFSENVEKFKTAGKEYFTTDRLPKKVGQIEKVTLEKLYNEKILLSLKDRNGNYCSAKKSYVSVEKMEKEYKMRVYLDCGDDKDYIIFPLEEKTKCTINTCDKEKEDTTENKNSSVNNNTSNSTNTTKNNANTSKTINNNTSKTTNNNTSNTNTSKTSNNNTNTSNTQAITIVPYTDVINDYRCNKKTSSWIYITSCQSTSVKGAKCDVAGGEDVLRSNLTTGAYCSTSKPGTNGNNTNNNTNNNSTKVIKYEYVKYTDGYWTNWSNYSKWSTTKVTANDYRQVETKTVKEPYTYYSTTTTDKEAGTSYCPSPKSGYVKVSEVNGICKYAKYVEISKEVDPICDTNIKDLVFVRRNGFTCVYRSKDKVTSNKYTLSKKAISSGSGWSVPANTNKYAYKIEKTTWMPKCSNGKCITAPFYVYSKYEKIYEKEYKYTNKGATCPKKAEIGTNSTCVIKEKTLVDTYEKSKVCPSGQNKINGKCYTNVTSSTKNTGYKDVTYYRYRTREYKKGTTYYEWSTSKNDTKLLNLGYKLTGKTDN